jgi:hypothetical protein
MSSDRIEKVGPTFFQLVKVKVRRNLSKAKLSGHCHWLVGIITRLDDSIGGAHANWKEAMMDCERV